MRRTVKPFQFIHQETVEVGGPLNHELLHQVARGGVRERLGGCVGAVRSGYHVKEYNLAVEMAGQGFDVLNSSLVPGRKLHGGQDSGQDRHDTPRFV